jgi:formylmethanofuran dehydrogenase subunit C
MSALTLTLKATRDQSLDCSLLTPENLANLTPKQIEKIELKSVLSSGCVGDFFIVSGTNSQHLIFKQAHAGLHKIGYQMTRGLITVNGDCGDYLGQQMQGGSIVCKGNAGERVGDKMRRGLILVEGNVGEYCAASMMAGTIGVMGSTGARLGYGMKRGTLLLAKTPVEQATWLDCGLHTLPFLNILYQSFKLFDTHFSKFNSQRVHRFVGDVSGLGKAEMLVLQSTSD